MWLKTSDNGYYNMVTGTVLEVKESKRGNDFRVQVGQVSSPSPLVSLQTGFKSREDAQDALDDVMTGQEILTLDVPDYADDSDVDDDESTEDDGESTEELNYEELDNEQLRAELAARNLATGGKKADLVTRLQEDDDARALLV